MSITFEPVEGAIKIFTYYTDDDNPEGLETANHTVRISSYEPSCNAHNSGGWAIQEAMGLKPGYCGRIPLAELPRIEALLSGPNWPEELERYRDRLCQVVRCAIFHNCDVGFG